MLLKTVKIAVLPITCAIIYVATFNNADAKLNNQELVTKIKEDNKTFSKILNAKSDLETLLKFLHEKIDSDAKITMKINNPETKDADTIEMNLSKADYINSFLYGPRQVKSYKAEIKTLKVDIDSNAETIKTKDMITESGIMLNPHDYQDKGRPFTSYTSCQSEHTVLESGDIKLTNSQCQTDIRYEEAV